MKNPQIKILITLLFVALSVYFVNGQQPYIRMFLKNTIFDNAQINCALQDNQGYLWFGTDAGIYKHDGLEVIESFLINESLGSGVSCMIQDSRENIWIGLKNGLVLQKKVGASPLKFESDSFPQKEVTCILEGMNNRIWFGTYGDGLFYTDGAGLMRINDKQELTDNYIYDLESDDAGNIWLGTDNGINIIQPENDRIELNQLSVKDGLPDFIVQCLEKDNKGNMWIGLYENGVCKVDLKSRKIEVPQPLRNWRYGPVNDLLAIDNRICIATDGKGILSYDLNFNQNLKFIKSDNADLSRVKKLFSDKESNVWLVSQHEVSLSLGTKLEITSEIDGKEIRKVHALTTAKDGKVWFGNDEGVFCFDPKAKIEHQQLKYYSIGLDLKHQKIMSLFADHSGMIWAGTFGQGVIRLDPKTGNHIQFDEKDGLANSNILAIEGDEKAIWFATLGGASRFTINSGFGNLAFKPHFDNYGKSEGLSNNFIYDINLDENNTVWFATDGSGVIYFKNGIFKPISNDGDFSKKVVYSVESDNDGNVWMNVANEGLYLYRDEKITKYKTDSDHASTSFNGILANNNHELVMVYDQGIDVLNVHSGNILHFEKNAGLESIKPDLNTLAKDADGKVWIGTNSFIIAYNATDSTIWKNPQTHINSVKLYLENIDTTVKHKFSYDENHFSFHYSGLWYQYPEKVLFRVKLEGHDIDWIETRNNNIIYSNLSPGTYTFRVTSGLQRDFGDGDEASFRFKIKKPFWASLWFILSVISLLAIIIISYIKIRERNIQQKQAVIRDRIMFQYENLKSQINPHFLFNSFSTLIALIETEPEKAVDYVSELSVLFRNVLEFKDKEMITLQEELKIAENYLQLQKKRFAENLLIVWQIPEELKISKIPPLTIQLLIENALKHNTVSRDKPLTISIVSDIEKGYIFVKNNLQLKKEVLSSTGIGIETNVNRYRILTQKEIIIDKSTDSFTVGIPIINN